MSAWAGVLAGLRSQDIGVDPGLSDDELAAIEERFGLRFPPDLRALLADGLPVGARFPDWRRDAEDELRSLLDAPVDGVLFDVERNGAWLLSWGERPADAAHALAIARERLADAPPLIPVYSHRYLPSEPERAGNPVLSVHQSDIIVYGDDLASYLAKEFGVPSPDAAPGSARHIRVWSDLVI